MGDSLTSASAGDYTWRFFSFKHLIQSGVNIDFVGPYQVMVDNVGVRYDNHDYVCAFDQDHSAIIGGELRDYLDSVSVVDTRSKMRAAVADYAPNAVVLFSGLNDMHQTDDGGPHTPAEVVAYAQQAVAQARAGKSDVKIVLTTVATTPGTPPPGTLAAKFKEYNDLLLAQAPSWSTESSPVVVALTGQNWGGADLTYDTEHPNVQGEAVLAAAIDNALNQVGIGAPEPSVPDLSAFLGPRQPAALDTPSVAGGSVNLRWVLPPGANRMRLERRDGGGAFSVIAERYAYDLCKDANGVPVGGAYLTPPYTCTFADPATVAGRSYTYRVWVAKSNLFAASIRSNVSDPVAGLNLQAPVATTPTAGVHAATVRWGAIAGVNGAAPYQVQWRLASGAWSPTASAGTTERTISGLYPGKRYGFRVRGVRNGAPGPWSTEVFAIPKANVMSTPAKPVLKQLAGQKVRVTWKRCTGANRYLLQFHQVGRAWRNIAFYTGTTYTSGKLLKKKAYEWRVVAYDGVVAGKTSIAARITVK